MSRAHFAGSVSLSIAGPEGGMIARFAEAPWSFTPRLIDTPSHSWRPSGRPVRSVAGRIARSFEAGRADPERSRMASQRSAAPTTRSTAPAATSARGRDRARRRTPERPNAGNDGRRARARRGLEKSARFATRSAARFAGSFWRSRFEEVAQRRRRRARQRGPVRLAVEDRDEDVRHALAVERLPAREHLVEDASERPEVRAPVQRAAARLLGAHVARGAEDDALVRRVLGDRRRVRDVGRGRAERERLREAEVEELDLAFRGHVDVRGLEVAVEDALGVRGLERVRDLEREADRLVDRDGSARDALLERLAGDELEDEEAQGVDLLEAVDRRDVRVIQGREDVRLAGEAREAVRVRGERVGKDLDRDVALKPRVAGPPDLAHPSGAQARQDLERSETGTRLEGHGARDDYLQSDPHVAYPCVRVRRLPCSSSSRPAAARAADPAPSAAWNAWPAVRVYTGDPFALKSAALRAEIARLLERHPGLFRVAEEGVSSEGRPIPLLLVGEGPTTVLLWSQMHGDEPTATVALLDVLNHLGKTRETPATKALLSKLTLAVIPMLNPDGAERTRRTNAQGIDINRDALRLQTPEGRFLKSVRDRLTPAVGYNLHNQGPNTLAGPVGRAGGDRAPRGSVRRGVHGERGAPDDEAARGPRARPPPALRPGPRLALRHGVHGARLRRLHDALGDADAPDRVGRLRGRGSRGGGGARPPELRRAPRHADRPRGRLDREGRRRRVRRDPPQRARAALRRRRPPRARDRGRRAPALPRGRRLERPRHAARLHGHARWAAGAAARSSRWATSTRTRASPRSTRRTSSSSSRPAAGRRRWAKALDGLKAKGLATPDGTLTLSLAALSAGGEGVARGLARPSRRATPGTSS